MDGIIFYWTSWMLWIVVTFLMPKSKQRTMIACLLLLLIASSNLYIFIEHEQILVTLFILLGSVMLIHTKVPNKFLHLFASFTIMIGYMAMLLWEKNTPIWMFLPRYILIPIISSFIIIILTNGLRNRLITGILGICAGEFVFRLMLSSYHLQGSIGSLMFLDLIFVTILLILLFELLQKGKIKLEEMTHIYRRKLSWQNER